MGKLINRIPGSRLLISSLPGSVLRRHIKLFESLGKPRDSTNILKALPVKFDIKRHSPSILYMMREFGHFYSGLWLLLCYYTTHKLSVCCGITVFMLSVRLFVVCILFSYCPSICNVLFP